MQNTVRAEPGESAPIVRRENFATRLDFAFDAITAPTTPSAPADGKRHQKESFEFTAPCAADERTGEELRSLQCHRTVHGQNLLRVSRPLGGGPYRIDCTAMTRVFSARISGAIISHTHAGSAWTWRESLSQSSWVAPPHGTRSSRCRSRRSGTGVMHRQQRGQVQHLQRQTRRRWRPCQAGKLRLGSAASCWGARVDRGHGPASRHPS
eukprot:COSAG02_NODE_187_length_30377_cov_3.636271_5_plen_209_part_00